MKRVVLIRPYYKEVLKQQSFPLGLGYLAAVLRVNNYWVRIYDLNILQVNNHSFIEYLRKIKPDFIGITALTWYYHGMVELSNLIKVDIELKFIPLIIGGVHVSSLPEPSLRKTKADYVVIGEGEKTIIELLKSLDEDKDPRLVDGIGFLRNNQYIETKPRELILDLDSLPLPAWDLIHPEIYPNNPHGFSYKKAPVFPIFTSRGCPFSCTYCASKNFWKQRIRYHSLNRIMQEIEYLQKRYNAKEIHIWDDNFTLNRQRVIEFCKEVGKRHLKLYFACPNGVKIDTLDYKLLDYLRSVGFYMLIFAIESGSPHVLKYVQKTLDLNRVPELIQFAKKHGYFTRGFFIIGLPSETINDVYKTINFALKMKLDQSNFFIFSPLPGSSFFKEWIKNKDIDNINWSFDYFNNPQDMTGFNSIDKSVVARLQKYIYIKFFLLRPFRLINYLLKIKISQYPIILDRMLYAFGIKIH